MDGALRLSKGVFVMDFVDQVFFTGAVVLLVSMAARGSLPDDVPDWLKWAVIAGHGFGTGVMAGCLLAKIWWL